MADLIMCLIWIGGIGPTYRGIRDKDQRGPVGAAFDAIFWPAWIGPAVAKYLVRTLS
jgi:hypothetical protein